MAGRVTRSRCRCCPWLARDLLTRSRTPWPRRAAIAAQPSAKYVKRSVAGDRARGMPALDIQYLNASPHELGMDLGESPIDVVTMSVMVMGADRAKGVPPHIRARAPGRQGSRRAAPRGRHLAAAAATPAWSRATHAAANSRPSRESMAQMRRAGARRYLGHPAYSAFGRRRPPGALYRCAAVSNSLPGYSVARNEQRPGGSRVARACAATERLGVAEHAGQVTRDRSNERACVVRRAV
jgi:hypothetical protein